MPQSLSPRTANYHIIPLRASRETLTLIDRNQPGLPEQRMNKINLRREFFKVSPQDVLDALKEHDVEILEFDLAAAAEEFRLSWPVDAAAEPV